MNASFGKRQKGTDAQKSLFADVSGRAHKPKREMFKTNTKLSMPSVQAAADRIAEQRFQQAHNVWKRQMLAENDAMKRVLR